MMRFNWPRFDYLPITAVRWLSLALITLFFVACNGGANEPAETSPTLAEDANPTLTPPDNVDNTDSMPRPTGTNTQEPAATLTASQPPTEEPLETQELGFDRMIREAREKLLGGTWVLSSFSGLDPNDQIPIDELQEYTLVFNEDGTFYLSASGVKNVGSFTTDLPNTLSLELHSPLDENIRHLPLYKILDALSHVERKAFSEDDQTLDLKGMRGDLTFERIDTPTAEVVSIESQAGIESEQITLDTKGLFSSWAAYKVPATNYTRDSATGTIGLPEHIVITFDGVEPANRQPTDAVMYIIPVSAYRALWDANGNGLVTKTLNELNMWLTGEGGSQYARGMAVMPFEEGWGIGSTEGGSSVWDNGFSVVKQSRYAYQGVTNNGQYFVALFVPAVGEDFFTRTQSILGDMVHSLTINGITGPEQNPIVNSSWHLQRIVYADGTVTEVNDHENYTFQIDSEGIVNYSAECSSGEGNTLYFMPDFGSVVGAFITSSSSANSGDCELTLLAQQFSGLFEEGVLTQYIMIEGMMVFHTGETLPDSEMLLYFSKDEEVSSP